MAQILKQEMYDRLLQAAESEFAESGYEGATVAAIARRAEVSAGNVYRYFENKDALFQSVISDEFANTFKRLLHRRVSALLDAQDLSKLPSDAEQKAEALLQLWISQRLKVVILLDRAQGSRFARFGQDFVDELVRLTKINLRRQTHRKATDVEELILSTIFQNTRRSIVAILERYQEEPQIRSAISAFWSYQLAGLAGFTKWVGT